MRETAKSANGKKVGRESSGLEKALKGFLVSASSAKDQKQTDTVNKTKDD